MWLEYNESNNKISYFGFQCDDYSGRLVFRNGGNQITSVRQSKDQEYLQIIEFDKQAKKLMFARDYLGFCPLLFSIRDKRIFIADDIRFIISWLAREGVQPTLSEQALALYFAMGYVPQGLTLFNEVQACENASIYSFSNGKVRCDRTFSLIETDATFDMQTLKKEIERQCESSVAVDMPVDVWCSGGLDSSIVAYCRSKVASQTSLLTFNYPSEIKSEFGDGEVRYAELMAESIQAPLCAYTMTQEEYFAVYRDFIASFPMPVIDICVPPKYLLAKHTKIAAMTGEGGDPIFSGVKNNFVLFMQERYPKMDLGLIYALSHKRFYLDIEHLFKCSDDLMAYVRDYFNHQFARYNCGLTAQLFYLNTFLKQGSLIFPESYYAAKNYNVTIKHPLTALSVYEMAFKLRDEQRYIYPKGKLALIELFQQDLPAEIIHRKKSGTLVPLYQYLHGTKIDLQDVLFSSGNMMQSNLEKILQINGMSQPNYLLFYAVMCLNDWLKCHLNGVSDAYISTYSDSNELTITN